MKKEAIKTDCFFAFSEGLATYLGIASQLFYRDKITFNNCGDYKYTSNSGKKYGDWECDLSKYSYGFSYIAGEGNELSIPSLLLKLMDEEEREYDDVSLGHKNIWNILRNRTHENILSLVTDIVNNNYNLKDKIALILEKEKISFSLEKYNGAINLNEDDDCWTINWSNSSNVIGKSNIFHLIFKTTSEEYVIKDITSTKYTLNDDEINKILSLKGDIIEYYIIGYNSNISLIEGYPSVSGYFNKGIYEKLELNSQKKSVLNKESYKWFKFIAPSSSKYLLEFDNDSDIEINIFNSLKTNSVIINEKNFTKNIVNNKLNYEFDLKKVMRCFLDLKIVVLV